MDSMMPDLITFLLGMFFGLMIGSYFMYLSMQYAAKRNAYIARMYREIVQEFLMVYDARLFHFNPSKAQKIIDKAHHIINQN